MSSWSPSRQPERAHAIASLVLAVVILSPIACRDELPDTDLHEAVQLEDLGRVRELLDAGADIDLQNVEGSTALHFAAEAGFREIALELIRRGASARVRDDQASCIGFLANSRR